MERLHFEFELKGWCRSAMFHVSRNKNKVKNQCCPCCQTSFHNCPSLLCCHFCVLSALSLCFSFLCILQNGMDSQDLKSMWSVYHTFIVTTAYAEFLVMIINHTLPLRCDIICTSTSFMSFPTNLNHLESKTNNKKKTSKNLIQLLWLLQ